MISRRAQLAFKRGQEWEERENSVKAINAYREAIAIEPDWLEPYQRLGVLFLELGRYEEALVTYRQVEPLAPPGDGSIDDLLHVLGQIQADSLDPAAYRYYTMARDMPDEQLDKKMNLCQKALSLSPAFAAPYAELGRILLAKGQLGQARAVLERGLAFDSSPFTQAALLFYLGHVLLLSHQYGGALDAFRQAAELDANPFITQLAVKQVEDAAAAGHT